MDLEVVPVVRLNVRPGFANGRFRDGGLDWRLRAC